MAAPPTGADDSALARWRNFASQSASRASPGDSWQGQTHKAEDQSFSDLHGIPGNTQEQRASAISRLWKVFLWITDAHGSKGCTRISAYSVRHSGLRLRGRRGDAFGCVHCRPRNPCGMATRARCAQAGMPGCEEKCFLAFHPCASMCIRGFNSLLESTRRRDGGNGRPLGLPPWRARPNLKAVPGGR